MSYIGNQITGFLGTGSLTVTTSTVAVEGDALFSADGNVVLGDASGDTITINAATASIPNNLNIDSNTLFIDASNNRVGIGNASPATALDVTGTITSDGLTVDGDVTVNTGAGTITIDSFGGSSAQIESSGAYKHISALSSGYHLFEVNSKSVAKFNNNGDISFYEDTGTTAKLFWDASAERLGLGTTSPDANLVVYESATSGTDHFAQRWRTQSGGVLSIACSDLSQANPTWQIRSGSSEPIAFNQASNERMRIDSSGNFLVSKTSSSTNTAGVEARSNGQLVATLDGGTALIANRKTSDGDVVKIMKDGSTVGSIGTNASQLFVASGDTGLQYNGTADQIRPCDGSGAARDNAIDLGDATRRFKDLYLGGKAKVLGGTDARIILGKGDENVDGHVKVQAIQTGGDTDQLGIDFYTHPSTSGSAASVQKMRLDHDGDVMVGTTSEVIADSSGTGLYYDVSKGTLQLKATGNIPIVANRVSSDGDIIQIRRSGTTRARIGITASDNLYIDATTNGGAGLQFWGSGGSDPLITPREEGSDNDNVTSLGRAANRFKDLYLGGGLYVGGTGSANYLDDYEEGSWTPAFSNVFLEGAFASATGFGTVTGSYIKIGAFVQCWAEIQSITGASGNLTGDDNFGITTASLPFDPSSLGSSFDRNSGTLTIYNSVGQGINASGPIIALANNAVVVCQITGVANTVPSTSSRFFLHLNFFTTD